MTISIRIKESHKRTVFNLKNLEKKHKKSIKHALYEAGEHLSQEVFDNISTGAKTGRIYTIKNIGKHQASAAGEDPANMTGKLKNSVDYTVRGVLDVEFGYREEYGAYLENGTKHPDGSWRIEPRPNLYNVAQKNTSFFIRSLKSHFKSGSKS